MMPATRRLQRSVGGVAPGAGRARAAGERLVVGRTLTS